MIACAAIIPVAERLPFVPVSPASKDIAFGCQDEIRSDLKFKIGNEIGLPTGNGAARESSTIHLTHRRPEKRNRRSRFSLSGEDRRERSLLEGSNSQGANRWKSRRSAIT